tara:strand:+ start:3033 stop:3419 length:387 start_codon:yes stop_codon:yes gene_type:complete
MGSTTLKHLIWSGDRYSLSIRRHWNAFFGFTPFFEINQPQMRKSLPTGAGYHIIDVNEACEAELDNFDAFGNWWQFSRQLCDRYCEYYVLGQAGDDNPFNLYFNQYPDVQRSVRNLAKRSRGYVGSRE